MVRGRRGSPRVGSWLVARRARGCRELLPLTVWWGWAGVLPVAGACGVAEQGGARHWDLPTPGTAWAVFPHGSAGAG